MHALAQKQNQVRRQASPNLIRARDAAPSSTKNAHPVSQQQRTADDQSDDASVSRFTRDFSRIPVSARTAERVQPKLKVSVAEDVYEQEADRVAAQVAGMGRAEFKLPRGGVSVGRQAAGTASETTGAVSVVQPAIESGQPLDAPTRAFMESGFGHDFSSVRVHADARAAESAHALDAHAYTVGRDVVFGAGKYAPATPEGRRLLAHELAHVVQQGGGGSGMSAPVGADNTLLVQRAPKNKST
ncbi:MAG TPA: DUF4157 domain-containing protein, partial [Pyrinomonadaceae bacterium]|nr:DUF4157 domain-containing protein [Pyrinomonadaceae bacterium]